MSFPEVEIAEETETPAFSFFYEGVCNNNVLIEFTEYMSRVYESFMTLGEFKIVLFCSNELLQNIGFYSIIRDDSDKSTASGIGKFSIRGDVEKIIITSENAVSPEQVEKITARLESYNCLDPEELKYLYKQMLKVDSPEDSKGGGIGLIEILRKSKNPVKYSVFEKENITYINLIITIWRKVNNG